MPIHLEYQVLLFGVNNISIPFSVLSFQQLHSARLPSLVGI